MLPHFIAVAREKVPEGEKKASKRFYGVQSQCCADMNFEKRLTSMKLFLGVICTMHKQLPVVQLHPASPSVCFMESTMLEDLNGRCVKVEQLDENDQVLGDCGRAVPVVSCFVLHRFFIIGLSQQPAPTIFISWNPNNQQIHAPTSI